MAWIEWGIGRKRRAVPQGHLPAVRSHLAASPAKYAVVIGLVIPLVVMIYYTYIESSTLVFMWFSPT